MDTVIPHTCPPADGTAPVSDGLTAGLRTDFALAGRELAAALSSRRVKDTPAARARIERCRAQLDRILDTTLEARSAR